MTSKHNTRRQISMMVYAKDRSRGWGFWWIEEGADFTGSHIKGPTGSGMLVLDPFCWDCD